MFHQSVYNAITRRITTTNLWYFGDILEKHNVGLVLSDHDHACARGHCFDNEVDGKNTGPVYVISSAGPKFYEAGSEDTTWDNNDVNRKIWAKETTAYVKTSVQGYIITINSVITYEGTDNYTSTSISGTDRTMDSFITDKCGESEQTRDNI